MTPLTITTKDGSGKPRELKNVTGSINLNGTLVAHVTTDEEKKYTVRLFADGREECECDGNDKWGRRCYHIKEVAARKGEFPRMADMVATPEKPVARKPRKSKEVPAELAAYLAKVQLPSDQQARKVRGKSQLVVAAKKQEAVAPAAEEAAAVAKAEEIVKEAQMQAPQWSNKPLTMDERIAASRKESEKRSQAPLNGNRGFSLWR